MEKYQGLTGSFSRNFIDCLKTVDFYHNACAHVYTYVLKWIENFVSLSLSLKLKKEYCGYFSEMKRNNFS